MRGCYAPLSPIEAFELGLGAMVRLGTYGDPAAIPGKYWDDILLGATGHTGYSHQANFEGSAFRPDLVMTSADSLEAARLAWSKGQRTFRVVADVSELLKGLEILCPASKEAGRRTTCNHCMLCSGNKVKAKSIAIPDHGLQAKRLNALFTRSSSNQERIAS